ncbi:hypothetical protein [Marinobacterium stanieri]|uniref:hypothetical protein n=1 Tax=Marinobacterium stanieri TaxID=49186 RepID=UPI000255A352|nr:hypothetical protein [Marinobacterium stanieri]
MKELQHVNPQFVQVGRTEAAKILGLSPTEFDRRRKTDPDCPAGFKERDDQFARVRFRLSDIYAYSEIIMNKAIPA